MMGHYVYNKTLTGAKDTATSQCFNENQLKGICAVWLKKKLKYKLTTALYG